MDSTGDLPIQSSNIEEKLIQWHDSEKKGKLTFEDGRQHEVQEIKKAEQEMYDYLLTAMENIEPEELISESAVYISNLVENSYLLDDAIKALEKKLGVGDLILSQKIQKAITIKRLLSRAPVIQKSQDKEIDILLEKSSDMILKKGDEHIPPSLKLADVEEPSTRKKNLSDNSNKVNDYFRDKIAFGLKEKYQVSSLYEAYSACCRQTADKHSLSGTFREFLSLFLEVIEKETPTEKLKHLKEISPMIDLFFSPDFRMREPLRGLKTVLKSAKEEQATFLLQLVQRTLCPNKEDRLSPQDMNEMIGEVLYLQNQDNQDKLPLFTGELSSIQQELKKNTEDLLIVQATKWKELKDSMKPTIEMNPNAASSWQSKSLPEEVANALLLKDGTLNVSLLPLVKEAFLKESTPDNSMIEKTLSLFQNDEALQVKLSSLQKPAAKSKGAAIVNATIGLPLNHEPSDYETRLCALAACMTNWKQEHISSCFVTARLLDTKNGALNFILDDFSSLLEKGSIERWISGKKVSFFSTELALPWNFSKTRFSPSDAEKLSKLDPIKKVFFAMGYKQEEIENLIREKGKQLCKSKKTKDFSLNEFVSELTTLCKSKLPSSTIQHQFYSSFQTPLLRAWENAVASVAIPPFSSMTGGNSRLVSNDVKYLQASILFDYYVKAEHGGYSQIQTLLEEILPYSIINILEKEIKSDQDKIVLDNFVKTTNFQDAIIRYLPEIRCSFAPYQGLAEATSDSSPDSEFIYGYVDENKQWKPFSSTDELDDYISKAFKKMSSDMKDEPTIGREPVTGAPSFHTVMNMMRTELKEDGRIGFSAEGENNLVISQGYTPGREIKETKLKKNILDSFFKYQRNLQKEMGTNPDLSFGATIKWKEGGHAFVLYPNHPSAKKERYKKQVDDVKTWLQTRVPPDDPIYSFETPKSMQADEETSDAFRQFITNLKNDKKANFKSLIKKISTKLAELQPTLSKREVSIKVMATLLRQNSTFLDNATLIGDTMWQYVNEGTGARTPMYLYAMPDILDPGKTIFVCAAREETSTGVSFKNVKIIDPEYIGIDESSTPILSEKREKAILPATGSLEQASRNFIDAWKKLTDKKPKKEADLEEIKKLRTDYLDAFKVFSERAQEKDESSYFCVNYMSDDSQIFTLLHKDEDFESELEKISLEALPSPSTPDETS